MLKTTIGTGAYISIIFKKQLGILDKESYQYSYSLSQNICFYKLRILFKDKQTCTLRFVYKVAPVRVRKLGNDLNK